MAVHQFIAVMRGVVSEETADATPSRRVFARRRRSNVVGGRQHSHRVKVTPQEEALLVQLAGAQRVSVPRLLVESALLARGETPTQRRDAMVELFALYRLLAAVSNNVNQIARHANASGEFPADAAGVLLAVRRVAERIDVAVERLAEP